MVKDALTEGENRMKGAIRALEEDLAAIRTGRASPALVERLNVKYYGTPTPLMQLATISAPEPRMLIIRPFDPASIRDIERAILASDLGLTPSNDGKLIRLNIPPLTEERRHELVLLASNANSHRKILDQYSVSLLDDMNRLVTAGALISYSFYTFSAANLPPNHTMMLTIPFLIYFLFRYQYLVDVKGEGGAPERF